MNQKAISIGIESYKEIVDRPYYYVDKTLLIKDLLDNGTLVSCFTRPRRFGKTLALSMLKTFFELEMDSKGNVIDNSHYFEGMKIAEAGECYMNQQGKYPVISLSLKSAKQPDFDMAYQCMIQDIAYEYDRHRYVLLGEALSDADKAIYTSIMERKGEKAQYATSLKFLAECLKKYHGRNVVILIDEYDVPLENAYFRGFYNQMIDFVRSLFESALKTNDSLEFAVITGCLRISRESIFTGLNNFKVYSITDVDFDEYFGFTDEEVREILHYYNQDTHYEIVKQWYDGYRFGDLDVYCPWDVINYCSSHLNNPTLPPENYWINTSGNDVLNHFINNVGNEKSVTRLELEQLVNGGTVQKEIKQNLTYKELYSSMENLWSALFMTGYLTQRGKADGNRYNLAIPNREIRNIITEHILILFKENVEKDGNMLNDFCNALLYGEAEKWKRYLQNICERQSV